MPDKGTTNADDKKSDAVDVAAITKSVTEAVTKQLTEQFKTQFDSIGELQKNVNTIAETLTKLPPAQADKKEAKKEEAVGLTPESVNKMIADALAANQKASAESAAKGAERQKLVDEIGKAKLAGNPKLVALLAGNTKEEIEASADKLAETIKEFKPDFGGATKDGGTSPANQPAPKAPIGNLTAGESKFASELKLPAK